MDKPAPSGFHMKPGSARTAICYAAPWGSLFLASAIGYVLGFGVFGVIIGIIIADRVHVWTLSL